MLVLYIYIIFQMLNECENVMFRGFDVSMHLVFYLFVYLMNYFNMHYRILVSCMPYRAPPHFHFEHY